MEALSPEPSQSPSASPTLTPTRSTELARELLSNIERVFHGKADVALRVVVSLLARGHVLLEDVPGVGKTTLSRALARSIEGAFHRIQFTSDLLPSDITGVSVPRPMPTARRRASASSPGPCSPTSCSPTR